MDFRGPGEEVQFRFNFGQKMESKSVKIDVKRVATARHGPILREMKATASRKVSRPLPVPKTLFFDEKTAKNTIFGKFRDFLYISCISY